MKNKLFKDSFFILLANGMTFITSMVITKIISATFSLTDYGLRSQVLTIVAVFTSFFSLGLSNASSYFIPLTDNSDGTAWIKVLRNIYMIAAPVCILVSLIVIVFGREVASYFETPDLVEYKYLIAVLAWEHIIYTLYAGSQIAQHKALRSTLTNLARSLTTVAVVALLCYLKRSIHEIIIGTACVDAVFCAYTVADATKLYQRIGEWISLPQIKKILKYCVPLGVSTITGTLCAQIDKLFISKLLTLDDLAVYTNMCTELPLAAISGAFIAVITPYVVKMIGRNEPEKAVELWGNFIELVAIILFPIITALFVFSRQAIVLLYSEEYIVGYHLFRLFALLEISRITYYGMILRSYGKSMLILMCSALTLVVNVILNVLFYFVFNMGMYGFALATLLSTFSILIFQLIVSSRLTGIKFSHIFPWEKLGICAAINIAFGLAAALVAKWIGFYDKNSILPVIATGIVWAAAYLAIEFKRAKRIYSATKNIDL